MEIRSYRLPKQHNIGHLLEHVVLIVLNFLLIAKLTTQMCRISCLAGRQIINKLYDIPPAYVHRPFTYPIYKHPVCTHYFGLYTFDALAGFKVQSSLPMTTNHCYSLKQALKNFPMDQLVVISRAWRKKRPPFLQTNCQKLNPSDGPP